MREKYQGIICMFIFYVLSLVSDELTQDTTTYSQGYRDLITSKKAEGTLFVGYAR